MSLEHGTCTNQLLLFVNVMGSMDDAVVRALASHQCGLGLVLRLDVTCVVDSGPCSERLFSGYSGFLLFSKTNISKFQINLESEGHTFVSHNRL